MEIRIDKELSSLHTLNFQKASDIQDNFSQLLLNEDSNQVEIGLCQSKIFVSNQNLFIFLEKYVGQKDSLLAESRKAIFRIIARFIKIRKSSVNDYLDLIYDKCIKLYKKEDSNKCKVAALWPIIMIMKYSHEFKDIEQIIKPFELAKSLVDELRFCKLVPSVKGKIWQLLGLIFLKFNTQLNDNEGRKLMLDMQQNCLKELGDQVKSGKPDLVFVIGALKFFRSSLTENKLSTSQTEQLFTFLKLFITEIPEIKNYKIINAAVKTLKDNLVAFDANLLIKSEEFFNKLLVLIRHDNRDVKENASDLFEKYLERLAEKLDEDEIRHKKIFNLIMDNFFDIIRGQYQDLFVLTVVIRTVGIFAKAIVKIRKEEYLIHFFEELIKQSEKSIISVFERYENLSRQDSIRQGLSFKVVLYRQKQLNSFIISYANLVRNLPQLTDYQVHHLFQICMLAVKQHYNYFEPYKHYLYEGLVVMISSFQKHPSYALLFVQRLISEGLCEGLKVGQYLMSITKYYNTANESAKLWNGLISQEKLWTQNTLVLYIDIFLRQINLILCKTDFGSRFSTSELQQEEDILQIMGKARESFHISNQPKDLMFFHRVTLVLSSILPNMPQNCCCGNILILLRNACNMMRKHPKAVLILIFTRVILKYIRDNNLLDSTQVTQRLKLLINTQIQRMIFYLIPFIKIYSGQLLNETLNLLLVVPIQLVTQENYQLLKQSYGETFKKGFQQGYQCLPLAFSAVSQIVDLVLAAQKIKNNTKFKLLLRYIKEVIPYLSGYLQIEITNQQSKFNKYFHQMVEENLDFNLDDPNKTKSLESSFFLIDQILPFIRLLSETEQTNNALMMLVKNFLGSIGGLCHMIVDSKINKDTLLAWDYESPLTFPIPLGARKFDIRIGTLLPRILEVCQNSQNQKIKVTSGELLHALTLYLIGKSAQLSNTNSSTCTYHILKCIENMQANNQRISAQKAEYAGILSKIFPVLLKIGAGIYGIHPCKQLFISLLMQTARWYANARQYEAPDVGQLLDTLMGEPCCQENPQLEQLASEILGEFVKWTLKQSTPEELKKNYGNIKTVVRRIQTFVSHPDLKKKKVGLLCISKLVEHTKNEQFIVEKYFMELLTFIKYASEGQEDQVYMEGLDMSVCALLSESLSHFSKILIQRSLIKRSGRLDTLPQLLDWLLNEAMKGNDSVWESNALKTWNQIIQKGQGLPSQQQLFTEKFMKDQELQNRNNKSIRISNFDVRDPNLLQSVNNLSWQCKLWTFILTNSVFQLPADVIKMQDFSHTLSSIIQYVEFFNDLKTQQQQSLKNYSESPLFEILQTLTQEDYYQVSMSQGALGPQNDQSKLISIMASSIPEELLYSFIKVFNGIFNLFLFDDPQYLDAIIHYKFQEKQLQMLIKVSCGLIMKPCYYLNGLQNHQEQLQIPLDLMLKNAQSFVIKAIRIFKMTSVFFKVIVPVLNEIFDGKYKYKEVSFEELLLSPDAFQDSTEMKFFLFGLKWVLTELSEFDQIDESAQFLNNIVQKSVELIKSREEPTDQDLNNNKFNRETNIEFYAQTYNVILEFCFSLDNQFLDVFCIETLLTNGIFKQKNESNLVEYLARRFQFVGQLFLEQASQNLSLLKYLVHIIQMVEDKKANLNIFVDILPTLNIDRQQESFISIEIKSNSILLSYLTSQKQQIIKYDHPYLIKYVRGLYCSAFIQSNSLEIHREGLILFGLYVKLCDQIIEIDDIEGFKQYLCWMTQDLQNVFRNKYFPLKIRELASTEETNFRAILKSIIDMINLTGRVEFISMLNPVIREDLQPHYEKEMNNFVKTFIQENFLNEDQAKNRQLISLKCLMDQILNEQLDLNPLQNLRVALAKKILIPMLQNSSQESLVQFFSFYGKKLDNQFSNTANLNDQWGTIILWIQIQIIIMDVQLIFKQIIQIMYQILDSERIKNDVHKNIYGPNSGGNELTKRVILCCHKIIKLKFEKLNNLEQASQQNDYDYQKLLCDYAASAYNCLVFTLLATQTKENLFMQQLFQVKRQNGESVWEQIIDKRRVDYNFQIETEFNEVSLQELNKIKLSKLYLKDTIIQQYLGTSSLGSINQFQSTFAQIDDTDKVVTGSTIEEEKPIQQQESSGINIELDEINRHQCMIPILHVIDFLEKKFPSTNPDDMPQWMVCLYQEVTLENVPLAIRIFIIKIVINRAIVFQNHSKHWLEVLLQYARKESKPNGGSGFHYFLRDVIVTIIQWSQDVEARRKYLSQFPLSRQTLSSVCNNLILLTAHEDKKLFKQNIEIVALLFSLWKEHIYICAKSINGMIKSDEKKSSHILWQQNGLSILKISIIYNVPVLIDYQEYIKTFNASTEEKYKYFLMLEQQYSFPVQFLVKMASNPLTKTNILKAIAALFGVICNAIEQYNQIEREKLEFYKLEISTITQNILSDNRPGYGKDRFSVFTAMVVQEYPQILNSHKIFMKCSDLIVMATSRQRASILTIFYNFLIKIDQYSTRASIDSQSQISEIILTIHGSIDKILSDQDPNTKFILLQMLRLYSTTKFINQAPEIILNTFKSILPQLNKHFARDQDFNSVNSYIQVLIQLSEQIQEDMKELRQRVISYLLEGFTSQHPQIRRIVFTFFENDRESKGSNKEMMDRLIGLLGDIYNENQETLWLRSAVPLLLSMSKKTSDYERLLFLQPLEETAKFYDIDFRNSKYYSKVNLTQQKFAGTQFTSSQGSLLSQATHFQENRGIRATQQFSENLNQQQLQQQQQQSSQQLQQQPLQQQSEQQQQYTSTQQVPQTIQEEFATSSLQHDADGFIRPFPKKKKGENFSNFIFTNELVFQPIQLSSGNRLRYVPDRSQGSLNQQQQTRSQQTELYRQRSQITPITSTNVGFQFMQNQTRQYRIGELPDIMIKWRDIINPLLEFSFEDEEIAGIAFTLLFDQIYLESEGRQKNLNETLLNLLERSKQKSLIFVSTIIKTMHEISIRSKIPFPKSDIIKNIGLESFAFYQSMLLLEESIILLENSEEPIDVDEEQEQDQDDQIIEIGGKRRNPKKFVKKNKEKEQQRKNVQEMGYWMDLIDLHQKIGNSDQIQGILSNFMDKDAEFTKQLNLSLNLKLNGQIMKSKGQIQSILDKNNESNKDLDISLIDELLHDRMIRFVQTEYDDALQKLGEWEELDKNLSQQCYDDPKIIDTLSVEMLKRIIHRNIRFNQRDEDLNRLKSIFERLDQNQEQKRLMDTELAFENSIVYLMNNDLDRARYSLVQSNNYFVSKWTQLSQGNNSLLSTDQKHSHLELLQRNYELSEFITLLDKKDISFNDFQQLFNSWKQRNPSVKFDSISAWDMLLQTRIISANQLSDIMSIDMTQIARPQSQWVTQNAQGMMRKGLFEQADYLLKDAYGLQKQVQEKQEFEWEFYMTAAKVNFKKLELLRENKNHSQLIEDLYYNKGFQEVDDLHSKHKQLCELFINEFMRHKEVIKEYHIGIKFQMLPLMCLESYAKANHDVLFLLAHFQQTPKYKNVDGFTQFYIRYAEVMVDLMQNYDNINNKISQIEKLPMNQNNLELIQVQRKFFSQAAGFFESCLRLLEPDTGGSDELRLIMKDKLNINLETIADGFFKYTVRLFQVGFKTGSQFTKTEGILIKLLKVVQKFHFSLGQRFLDIGSNNTLPSWLFLPFVSQIIHILNNPRMSVYFEPIFNQLAQKYPEQFVYQFNVSFELERDCHTELAQRLYQQLRAKIPLNFEFMDALNQVTHPEHRMCYYLERLRDHLNKDHKGQKEIVEILQYLKRDVFDQSSWRKLGEYNVSFINKYSRDFEKLNNTTLDLRQVQELIQKIKSQAQDIPYGYHKLSDLSKWFFLFKFDEDDNQATKMDIEQSLKVDILLEGNVKQSMSKQSKDISIPGQLQESSSYYVEPDEKNSVKVASFDESILIMKSIRRPKRLTIFGSDEKSYKILVKGAEDLRLDQRIEQLFSVMNSLLENSQESSKRDLRISTYAVIPMTKTLGVLEWVDSTKVLKEILEKEYQEIQPSNNLGEGNPAFKDRVSFLQRECLRLLWNKKDLEAVRLQQRHISLLHSDSQRITDHMEKMNNFIPQDLLRDSLKRISASLEAFVYIRDRFIRYYSVICIAGYLLGIGDRHLENFLLNFSTGEVIAIDFGFSFGQGISLYLPEMMPFRLTRVFEGLTKPVGLNGIFRHSMIHALTSIRKRRYVLLDFCEIFINDPLLDQIKIAKDKNSQDFLNQIIKQQQLASEVYQTSKTISQDSLIASENENLFQSDNQSQDQNFANKPYKIEEIWYPYKKIDIMRQKLIGIHSAKIMIEELDETKHKKETYYPQIKDAVMGQGRPRAKLLKTSEFATNLSVVDQVDCLIDHATDPNILGRTWIGWTPYL